MHWSWIDILTAIHIQYNCYYIITYYIWWVYIEFDFISRKDALPWIWLQYLQIIAIIIQRVWLFYKPMRLPQIVLLDLTALFDRHSSAPYLMLTTCTAFNCNAISMLCSEYENDVFFLFTEFGCNYFVLDSVKILVH